MFFLILLIFQINMVISRYVKEVVSLFLKLRLISQVTPWDLGLGPRGCARPAVGGRHIN